MNQILKKVLTLNKSAPAANWLEMEGLILPQLAQFNKPDFLALTKHYGIHEQGSEVFWQSMQKKTLNHFKEYTANEFLDLMESYVYPGTKYPLDNEFNLKMGEGLEWAFAQSVQNLNQEKPEFVKKTTSEFKKIYDEFLSVANEDFEALENEENFELKPEYQKEEGSKFAKSYLQEIREFQDYFEQEEEQNEI